MKKALAPFVNMSDSRDSIKLAPAEVDTLKQIFNASLKELVEDEGEMSDLLNFTVVMIQNGKSVPEMEQELDDIYGGEYAKRIGVLLNDYFEGNKEVAEEPEDESGGSSRVVSIKVRQERGIGQMRVLFFSILLLTLHSHPEEGMH